MAVLPEQLILKVLRTGFRSIRKDTRIINTLFYNLDLPEQQKIKDLVLTNSIDVSINFPRTTPKLPALIMVLKNESESQTFIGNVMGSSPDYDTPGEQFTADLLGGGNAPVSNMTGLPKLMLDKIAVGSATNSRIYFNPSPNQNVTDLINSGINSNIDVYITAGKGAGKKYPVIKLNSNFLDIDGSFDPQLDTTSIIQLREDTVQDVVGEPAHVYPAGKTNLMRTGANYSAQYQLLILTGSQEETIYLYYIVKAILFSQAAYLEGQGLQALQISGTDLAPRPELIPQEVFQRALNMNFVYPFDFIEENGVAFTNISVSIGCDDDTADEYLNFSVPL